MFARRSRAFASLFLIMLPLSVLRADVTLRYKTEVKPNPGLSAQMTQGLNGAAQEMVLRLKGGKGFSQAAGFSHILDFSTKEVTYLDTAGKRYARLPYDQLVDEMSRVMPVMPAAAGAAMASMKIDVSPVRLTGRTEVIQGVEAEEREIDVSVEAPAVPNMPAGPVARMVMQFWTAKPGEVMRVPALRELTGYSLFAYATMNPVASVEKMMKQMPGFANVFEPLMKGMRAGTTSLRVHMDMYMPAMAAALQRMPAGSNALGAGFDPNAPFMQMNQEVVEISSEPVPDSFFQIPEGYQEAPIAELLKGMVAKSQARSAAAVSGKPQETAPAVSAEVSAPQGPDDAASLVRLGRLAHVQGKHEEGDAYYRKAVEFGDNAATAPALIGLGVGSFIKDKAAARSYFERALNADVNGPAAGPALTWMASLRESDDPQSAASLYNQALGLETAPSADRALTLELLARLDGWQGMLRDDKAQAAQAQELAAEARRIRTQRVAALSTPRKVGPPVSRGDGSFVPPKLVARREPVYAPAAQALKITGVVVLSVVADVDGSPRDIQLKQGLGYGLDEAAAATVSQWRFVPGTREGVPVPIMANIEVNFRML